MNTTDSLINQRYRIIGILGQGGTGITYQAEDVNSSTKVAIKILSLDLIDDFKKLEYFGREAQILQQLDHPKIPKYFDYFVSDKDNYYYQISTESPLAPLSKWGITPDKFYLVQELIEGKSLFQLVENGWQPDEKEVKNIAIQVLKILVYLQQLIPPVVHRDIKPQNLIYTENREVFLVDFGAVQDQVRQNTFASSVVGTYGYMAMEQFKGGKTYPSTDLYSLGATLIYLLTRKHPSDLPQKRLRIDWQKEVKISTNFRNWLDKLIEPNHEHRILSAQIALDILSGKLPLEKGTKSYQAKPTYSSIKLIKTEDELNINIPCVFSRKRVNSWKLLGIICYVITLLMILFLFLMFGLPFYPMIIFIILVILLDLYTNPAKGKKIKKRSEWWQIILTWIIRIILLGLIFIFSIILIGTMIEAYDPSDPFFLVLLIILSFGFSEVIKRNISQNLFKELFFNTELIITKNKEVIIQQKLGTFCRQSQERVSFYSSYLDQHEKDSLKLLTQAERRWLQKEIYDFLDNKK